MTTAPKILDLFAPDFQADPFPTYAELRAHHPVCPVEPGGFLALSRHADVVAAFRDPARFSSAGFRAAFEPEWLDYNPGAHTMLSMDPPEHGKNRNLVSRAFLTPAIARVEPAIRALTDRLVDGLAAAGETDFVADFAGPLTAGALGEFLDFDPALHARFKHWSDTLASVRPVPEGPEHVATVKQAIREMESYFSALIAEHRARPGDDMVSMLVHAEVDGDKLGEKELIAFFSLLLVAGLETTVNLLAKSLVVLTDRPDLFDRLRAEPAVIPRFVEEMLRFDPPTHSLFRVTTAETEIAGTKLPAGAFVMLLLASANRDAEVFPDPDVFDLDRVTQNAVAFGYGPHFCIGAALARLEGRAALEALTARFRRVERPSGPIAWRHTLTVRGPVRLPLRFFA